MNIKLHKLLLKNEVNDDLYVFERIVFYFSFEFLIIMITLLYITNDLIVIYVIFVLLLLFVILMLYYDSYLFVGRYTLDNNGEIETIIFKRDLEDYEVFNENSFDNLLAVYVENQEVVQIKYKGKEIDINTIKIIYFDDDVDVPGVGKIEIFVTILWAIYLFSIGILIFYKNFIT